MNIIDSYIMHLRGISSKRATVIRRPSIDVITHNIIIIRLPEFSVRDLNTRNIII